MAKLSRHKEGMGEGRGMLTPEEIGKKIEEEFNPVKKNYEGFEEAILEESKLDPEEEKVLEETRLKKDFPYDRTRLEFLRMTIGPIQNFYTTLGNILLSISERLAKIEERLYAAELKGKMQEEYALLVAREGHFVSGEEFKLHWEKLEKEKASENKKS